MKKIVFTIITVVSLVFLFFFWGGNLLTKYSINNKITQLRDSTNFSNKGIFTYNQLDSLPPLLNTYFKTVLNDSVTKPNFVTLAQIAHIKTDEDSEWMQLEANEYFTTKQPNFLWDSKLQSSKFFWVQSIDSYINGKGNMLIKLNSSLTISDTWSIEMDKSGLFRYISEALLFPTSLLPSKNLQWNILDSNVAEIKFSDKENSVVCKVFFTEDGTINKMQTLDKYRTTNAGYMKTLYTIYYSNNKWLTQDYFVPTHFEVEWNLPKGKFKYGKFDITNITYE
ncbi:MAG: hypothetical protein GY936_06205 [Ignavibacteriae bacterium]|nr:hypothetical protein [Ignavibacteriota bacterium]